MTSSDRPSIGVVEAPELTTALTLLGFNVVGGGEFRSAALAIRQLPADAAAPVIVFDVTRPGLRAWAERQSGVSRVIVLHGATPGSVPNTEGPNRVHLQLPATIDDVLAAAGWGPTPHPLGQSAISQIGSVADLSAYASVAAEPEPEPVVAEPAQAPAPAPAPAPTPAPAPAPVETVQPVEIPAIADTPTPLPTAPEAALPDWMSDAPSAPTASSAPVPEWLTELGFGDTAAPPAPAAPPANNAEPVAPATPLLPEIVEPPAVDETLFPTLAPAEPDIDPMAEFDAMFRAASQGGNALPAVPVPNPVPPAQPVSPDAFEQMVAHARQDELPAPFPAGNAQQVDSAPAPQPVAYPPQPEQAPYPQPPLVQQAPVVYPPQPTSPTGVPIFELDDEPAPTPWPQSQPPQAYPPVPEQTNAWPQPPAQTPVPAVPQPAPQPPEYQPVPQAPAFPPQLPAYDPAPRAPGWNTWQGTPNQNQFEVTTDSSTFGQNNFGTGADYVEPQPSKVFISFAGKGGVGKSNMALALAECCASVGMRVALVDMNRGQGDVRIWLKLQDQNVPTIYNAAISGNIDDGILTPDMLTERRSRNLPALGFALVLAPPPELADPAIVTTDVYRKTIEYLTTKVDLVIVDTQIIEAQDVSGLHTDLVIPLLRSGAHALGITDMSPPGLNNLLATVKRFATYGIDREATMLMVNMAETFDEKDRDTLDKLFSAYSVFAGAAGRDLQFKAKIDQGVIDVESATFRPLLNRVLLKATGNPAFEKQPEAKKSGFFRRRR